jgi:hypothetical protein
MRRNVHRFALGKRQRTVMVEETPRPYQTMLPHWK